MTMRLLAIIAILAGIGALIAGSYLNSKIEALRADTDRTYAMAQRLEQRFINNKMLMLEGKWKRE